MIGDHQGGDGFHEPVVKAAASYVGEHGAVGTDPEALYLLLRNAVLTANATNHDPETVADRASRDHIMPAILSAITKFGSQSTARRKTKLHAGVHPHFTSEPISVAEAQRRLAEIATLGF